MAGAVHCGAEVAAAVERAGSGESKAARAEGGGIGTGSSTAQYYQKRSFSRSLSLEEPEREDGPPKQVDIQLSAWERFLAGELICPCFSFCVFLVIILAMTAGGVAGSFKLSETGGEVLSNDIVQLYYAQKHLREQGCVPGEIFDGPICSPGVEVASGAKEEVSAASLERSLPGNAVLILYEATGTSCPGDECDASSQNLLTERNMKAMKKFEDALFGAKDFQEDHCLLRHPSRGGAAPVCNPPISIMSQLFSEGREVVESVKELFDTGFGSPLGECICSLREEPCAACANESTQKAVAGCMLEKGANAAMSQQLLDAVNQSCATLGGGPCQHVAPFLSPLCSTAAWDHTKNGSAAPLQGAELGRLLERICDTQNAAMSPLRRTVLPSFACEKGSSGATHLSQHGTPFLMSMWMLGHSGADQEELESEYAGRLWQTYQRAAEEAERDTEGEMRPMMFTSFTALKSIERLLIHDCALAFGSFMVVFCYMWFTTESFFLSSMGMLQIVMSCPPAFLVWKIINPDGVGFLQFLSIFMILGIGADDVFVLLDAWKQARVALGGKGTAPQVFALGYRRAFAAMLTTTATTGAAFLFGAFSPIPSVSQFCLFACIVVVFDFLWCISFFASSLCVYERFFLGHSCCCFGAPRPAGSCGGPGCCCGGVRALCSLTPCGSNKHRGTTDERALERFSAGPLFNFVRRYKVALLAFWLLVTAVSAGLAGALLKTASKPPEMGDESHDLVRFGTLMQQYYTLQEQQLVTVSWGLPEESPVSKFTSTNPITPDVALLDAGAELLTSPEGQQAALALCRSADQQGVRCESESQKCLVYGSPGQCSRDSTVWSQWKVDVPSEPYCATGRYCFVEWVAEYAEHHANLSFPFPATDFVPLLQSHGFKMYLEGREAALQQAGRHWDSALEKQQTGWIIVGDKLKFAWMSFNASFKSQGTKEVSNEWHELWKDHVGALASATAARQSSDMYVFMVLQNELLAAAIQGMLVSLGVTAVILALVTFNWMLALIGLVNISVITAIFLGVMPLIPWELGSNECIFLIAVVGLAVDYTVHLLHAYNEHDGTREEKMQGALSTMGVSVASGAITTMGAGITLFMCDIAFFQQYGSFIFLVILISLLLALTNLPPLILVFGPEGDRGKIAPLYWLHDKLGMKESGAGHSAKDAGPASEAA